MFDKMIQSPTLFGLYINDMIEDIKSLNLGIQIGDQRLCIPVYANDLVMFVDNETKLQLMMDKSSESAIKCRIKFTNKKSNVVYFRKKSKPVTNVECYLSGQKINIVEQYTYLGVMLMEFVDFDTAVKQLSNAGVRALGSILNKD